MKKSIALVLFFILVLVSVSGCILKKEPDEPSAGGLYFELEGLPDIGEFSLNKKAEYFFSDGAHSDFEPRNDYGALLPYYASVDFYSQPYDNGWDYGEYGPVTVYESTYGLMTADGKIITDSLWSSYRYYDFDENSGIFYLSRIGNGNNADIISSNGSWKIEAEGANGISSLFSFGQPLFMLGVGSECKIYSIDGTEKLDISQYVAHEAYYDEEEGNIDYYYNPDIIYADENMILLRTVSDYIEQVYIEYNNYFAIDYSGNVLYSFSAEGANISYLGGHLLEMIDFETYEISLLNINGQKISPEGGTYVYYSKEDNIALSVHEEEGELLLSWYNADGKLTEQKTLDKTSREFSAMNGYPDINDNGVIFHDYDDKGGLYYNIFAEPINFPVKESEISRIEELYYNIDSGIYSYNDYSCYLYFCVFTLDGKCLICNPGGELLFEVQPPKTYKSSSDEDYEETEIYIRNGYILSLSEDDILYAYPLSGGEVVTADVSTVADEFGRFYAFSFSKNFAVIDISRNSYMDSCIYSFNENRIIHCNMECYNSFAGFYLIGTKTYTAVLSADGNEIMRLPLGGLA